MTRGPGPNSDWCSKLRLTSVVLHGSKRRKARHMPTGRPPLGLVATKVNAPASTPPLNSTTLPAISKSLAGKAQSKELKSLRLPPSNFQWGPNNKSLRARNLTSMPNRTALPARRFSPARVSRCLGGKEMWLVGDAWRLAAKETCLSTDWSRLARKEYRLPEPRACLAGKGRKLDERLIELRRAPPLVFQATDPGCDPTRAEKRAAHERTHRQ